MYWGFVRYSMLLEIAARLFLTAWDKTMTLHVTSLHWPGDSGLPTACHYMSLLKNYNDCLRPEQPGIRVGIALD